MARRGGFRERRGPPSPSSFPSYICSPTSSALPGKGPCLSKGVQGFGAQRSLEARLWGWRAARTVFFRPLLRAGPITPGNQ